jgi:predicted patatin/cPLA2 family phospholipase
MLESIRNISLILLILVNFNNSKDSQKCYVLALEGGGDKGAYQAGVIKGLVNSVPNGETKWNVITGISVGSLNGAGLSIFDVGQEKEAADFIISIWQQIKGNKDIYQNFWGGPLYGLLYKNSLYDTSPLRKLLDKFVQSSYLKRKFIIGATNFETGAYDKFDEESLNVDEYTDAILSSSAVPILFPNIKFRNNNYMDGGVKIGVDIPSGINKCLDDGFSEKDIIVDVILCNSKQLPRIDTQNYHTLDVLIRYLEINCYDSSMRAIDETRGFFPNVNYRYIVGPSKSLPSGSVPLTFSPKEIDEMIQIGLNDALNAVDKGPNSDFIKLVAEFKKERREMMGRRNK